MASGDWPQQPPITFRADTWRGKVVGAWLEAADSGHLTRQDIFAVSDAHRKGAVTTPQFVVAVGIWGYAKGGRGGYRVRHWLDDPALTTKVDRAIGLARAGELQQSYRSLQPRAENHVHGLGPAFFTKLLYFAAYQRGHENVQPLILDRFVALGLKAQTQTGWPTTGWSAKQYLDYLHEARRLADAPDGPGEPDLVEHQLFNAGKEV